MTDYRIYKKLRPFILKRILYAFLGLLLILGVLALATYWGMKWPDYREAIIALCAVLGIFIGWKIIRKGESRYRMAQVAVIVDILRGTEYNEISSKNAMKRVKSTFKYATIFGFAKNVWRHKNFKKARQFFSVMAANCIPYVGTCSLAWIFAHPEEERLKGACHAISNYYEHRGILRWKVIKAFIKELVFAFLVFLVIFLIEMGIYWLIMTYVADLDVILDKVEDFTETIELVYDWYFEENRGYTWNPIDVMTIIAIYCAWFIKVFSMRAYQMIAIIRVYLAAGEKDPPSDALYNRLMAEWEKSQAKRAKKHAADHGGDIASEDTARAEDKKPDSDAEEDEHIRKIDEEISEMRKEIMKEDGDS